MPTIDGTASKNAAVPAAASLDARLKEAVAFHQRGNLAEAEHIYKEILQRQPNHFHAFHLLGVIAAQTGRAELAVELISKAIGINSNVAAAYSNRGKALQDLKRSEEALASYERAIALKPDFAEAHSNRGYTLLYLKRPEEALASYDRAIALKPDFAEAYNIRGNALQDLKRPDEALASYDRAITLKPNYVEAYGNRGNALLELKRPNEALASYDRAIALKPDLAEAYNVRGNALQELKRPEEAVGSYDRAIALKPDFAEAYNNRGNALQDLKRAEEALGSYDRAIALKPDFAEAHSNRGNVLLLYLQRPKEALASYDRAIALKPDLAEAYSNRGKALQDLKRPEEAQASYDRAISLKPDFADAFVNKSFGLLLLGKYELGWRLHEWRKKVAKPVGARSFRQPLWLGEEDITGKTLFIHWEQGLGDTIQFCRYVKLVEARGAKVIMSVQEPLYGLLKQISANSDIIHQKETPADFDFHCPLLSLPLALGTTLETIPAERQYLKADNDLRDAWSARLPSTRKPKIGLVWSGRATHKNDHNRSIALEQLVPLLSLDAHWISLQKELRDRDRAVLVHKESIAYFGDDLRDFNDTAALLDLLDLVIAVDTSVAHLAGAMGKPVWILLPYNSPWQWLLDRTDSPWYPSAKLFRQKQIGDWAEVIDRVSRELRGRFQRG